MCFNWQRIVFFVSINSKWKCHWIISHFGLLNFLHQKAIKFTYNVFKWFPYVAIALDISEISLAYFIVGIDKNTYETMQWHYWLAHLNIVSMKNIQKNSIMPTILNFINFPHFESCIMDKHHKEYFFTQFQWDCMSCYNFKFGAFRHMQIYTNFFSWGEKHFISFIDDYLRYAYVYHFKH
jgi:hypothetical protein